MAEGGGCVEYDIGGGREVLIAASAQLAAATNSQLTIVESRVRPPTICAVPACCREGSQDRWQGGQLC